MAHGLAAISLSVPDLSDFARRQRRSLIGHGLAERADDGREYRRIERAPTAGALALPGHLRQRRNR
ncbi:MAG: hypothetical protein R3D56_04845 [Paracoccaceae bacterium]